MKKRHFRGDKLLAMLLIDKILNVVIGWIT